MGCYLKGLGSKVAMTAVMLWLVVGMYGAILKSGHIVEGLVWVSVKLGVSGAVFTVPAHLFSRHCLQWQQDLGLERFQRCALFYIRRVFY